MVVQFPDGEKADGFCRRPSLRTQRSEEWSAAGFSAGSIIVHYNGGRHWQGTAALHCNLLRWRHQDPSPGWHRGRCGTTPRGLRLSTGLVKAKQFDAKWGEIWVDQVWDAAAYQAQHQLQGKPAKHSANQFSARLGSPHEWRCHFHKPHHQHRAYRKEAGRMDPENL